MTAQDRIYWRTRAYQSAVAHPYHVSAFADWSAAAAPVTVGFQTEAEARAFASLRPEPIIDLVRRNDGPIAVRRMLAHPSGAGIGGPRDDFPHPESLPDGINGDWGARHPIRSWLG